MRARKRYPQFEDWTAEEFTGLLRIAKLSDEDREIAAQCVVWRMNMIDIGAAHCMDRSTVSRRLERIILPELMRMTARLDRPAKAGA